MARIGLSSNAKFDCLLSRLLAGLTRSAFLLAMFCCLNGEPAHAQVTTEAGLNDLVILDPGQHERGLPAVIVEYMNGHPEIDVPPTVHVHRYFYSGDKIFQGPIIQGGPTVLVANHPKTGERMYINAVLPPGAPRIAHSKNSISYIYKEKRVEVQFQSFPFDPCVAVVKHHSGKGLGLAVRDTTKQVRTQVKETLKNSQMVHSVHELAAEGHTLVKGAVGSVGQLSSQGTDTIKQLISMIPGVSALKSAAEQNPQKQYESTIRNASLKQTLTDAPFVRTNR